MKLTRNRVFRSKITVTVPNGDTVDVQTFYAHFKAIPVDAMMVHRLGTSEEQAAFLRDVLVGWDGITDDRDGVDAPMEVTPENLELVIGDTFVRTALLDKFGKDVAGAARGN